MPALIAPHITVTDDNSFGVTITKVNQPGQPSAGKVYISQTGIGTPDSVGNDWSLAYSGGVFDDTGSSWTSPSGAERVVGYFIGNYHYATVASPWSVVYDNSNP